MKLINFLYFILFISLFITGCSAFTMSDENYSNHQNLDELRPSNQPTDSDLTEILGYVRYSEEDKDEFIDSRNFIGGNRTQTADMITRRILLSADFHEVASLVTDKEIIVAYDRNTKLPAQEADEIAKKTAASFVPGFYKIHTTNDSNHIDRIQQIHLSSAQGQLNQIEIEKLITEIDKTN